MRSLERGVFEAQVPFALNHHSNLTQDNTIRVILPFKDQESANIVKKRLNNLSSKIQTTLRPVFVSRKLNQDLQVREAKTS